MYIFLFIYLFFGTVQVFSFISIDTVSIKGDIKFNHTNITGNLVYTLKNNTSKELKNWEFIIHPSVNILSVMHNNSQVTIDIEHGFNYRILKLNLPNAIPENTRTSIIISFLINPQKDNSRFMITDNYVFLDPRQFWFPYPVEDNQVYYEFTISTPKNLTAIMGGKKINEAIIINNKISTWKNEILTLIPSAALIITDFEQQQQDALNIYGISKELFHNIYETFMPIWNHMKKTHKYFPLSEIHLIPMHITLPDKNDKQIDGEFLGNLFLIDASIINDIQDQNTSTFKNQWTTSNDKLIEILIHELYHSLLPGLAKHQKDESLFMESLVQYLSWDVITQLFPEWGNKIWMRTRYYIQNLFLKKNFNYLWDFLLSNAFLYSSTHINNINGINLADIIVEKYQFIGYSSHDIFNSIDQNIISLSNTNFLESNINNTNIPDIHNIIKMNTLFNSTLTSKKTNFHLTITNINFFKKKKIINFNVTAYFLSISHNYPFTWKSKLIWINDKVTNHIDLIIEKDHTWETNIIGDIQQLQLTSPFDIIESNLSDNFFSSTNIGKKIIQDIQKETLSNIIISDNSKKILQDIKNNQQKIIWDSTSYISSNSAIIGAFLIQEKKKVQYLAIPIQIYEYKNSKKYIIDHIIYN